MLIILSHSNDKFYFIHSLNAGRHFHRKFPSLYFNQLCYLIHPIAVVRGESESALLEGIIHLENISLFLLLSLNCFVTRVISQHNSSFQQYVLMFKNMHIVVKNRISSVEACLFTGRLVLKKLFFCVGEHAEYI